MGITLVLAGLLMASGCSHLAGGGQRVRSASPSPTAALRLNKPEKFLDSWPESPSGVLQQQAQYNTLNLKQYLDGEPTSTVAAAYTTVGFPYDALVSAVSGKVTDPKAALDGVFAARPRLSGVKPTRPGPTGGEARCGTGETQGVVIDLCAWANHDTVGMMAFLGFPHGGGAGLPELLVKARYELEHPVT